MSTTRTSGCSFSVVKSGVNSANITAAGTHGSMPSFLPALYATATGRKKNTEPHMASTNCQPGVFTSALKSTRPIASRNAAKAMISEAPSSTPRIGRKESERYSKNASSQGTLPLALSRCRFFNSSSETLRLAISGSEFIALYTVATSPPTMTW